jgi:hypothetical protein
MIDVNHRNPEITIPRSLKKYGNKQNKTLGLYLKVCMEVFGSSSSSVSYLQEQIKLAPLGEKQLVDEDESKTLNYLLRL